jgi:hypothetical protein
MTPGSRVTCRVTGAPSGSVVKWKIGGGARIVSTDEWKREAVVEILKPGEVVLSAAVGGQTLQIKLGQAGAAGVSQEAVPATSVREETTVLVGKDPAVYTSGTTVKQESGAPVTKKAEIKPTVAVSRGGAEGEVRVGAKPGRIHFEVPDYTAVSVTLPPAMDLSDLDTAQWAGSVSAAREAMRMVFGEMTPEETEKFEAKWKPLLAFPCKEVVAYMNKLNPLLAQFLALRRAAAEAGLAMDRVQFEAAHLVAYRDMEGFAGAMQGMATLRAQVHGIERAMERVVQAIVALGDPPDAVEEQKKARKRHGEAFAMFAGGSGLEGEWVGVSATPHEIEANQSIRESVGGAVGRMIEEMNKKKTPEQKEAEKKREEQKQAAWQSGKPIPAQLAEAFGWHWLISRVPTSQGDRWHFYRFDGSDVDRGEYERDHRMESFESDRAACDYWMERLNFLWPELEEGNGYWKLEHTSRNPSCWGQKWEWEFQLQGSSLLVSEKCYYPENYTDLDNKEWGSKLRRHRTWELRRVAQESAKPKPADWSVEKAVQPMEHPASAWVLKEVKAKSSPSAFDSKDVVEIAENGLSGTITHTREETVEIRRSAPEGAKRKRQPEGPSVARGDEDVEAGPYRSTVKGADEAPDLGGADEQVSTERRRVPCVAKFQWQPALPKKLMAGESVVLNGSVAVSVPSDTTESYSWSGNLKLFDPFSPRVGFGESADVSAEVQKGNGSRAFDYKGKPIGLIPYKKGATRELVLTASSSSMSSFEVRFIYESVPADKAEGVVGKPVFVGTGSKAGGTKSVADESGTSKQIKFHQDHADYFGKLVQETEARLRAETNPASAIQLQRDLLYQKDAWQRQRDQIATIQTGEFVHTRTAADEFNQRLMAEEGRRMAEKFDTLHRIIERMPRLIASAPPEEQQKLRDFYNRHVNSATIASGDVDGIKKAAGAIADTIGGIRQREQAEAEEDLVWEEYKTASAETVKGAADFSLMALSSAAGPPGWGIFAGYSALTTGYMDGNPVGALKQTLTGVSAAGAVADQIFAAYQNGVVKAYEDYAKDPTQGPVNEVEAGLSAAGWEGAKTAAMIGGMRLGLRFFMGPTPPLGAAGAASSKAKFKGGTQVEGWMTIEEFTKQRSFLQAQGVGRDRLKQFEAASEQYWKVHNQLRATGLGVKDLTNHADIRSSLGAMRAAYGKVKVDYHAKMLMNQSGNKALLSSYNKMDTMQMQKVQGRLRELMEADGYNPQQYKLFSNSASSKKAAAGMDVDLGVDESAPEFLKGIFQTKDGLTRKVPMHEYREAGQKKLQQAFRDVMGEEWEEPFLLFTNSRHKEAYKKGADYWLGNKQVPHAVVENIAKDGKGWTQQAASVTRVKVDDMSRALGLDDYTKLQEQCRGMTKDFDTKLAPLLGKTTNKEAVQHMQEIYLVMDQFGKNQIGPVEADRKLRLLSGGRGMEEIADQFRSMLEGLAGGMAK